MEMCPYCGEDVPADSKNCWKCGTEISRSGTGDGGDQQIQPRGKRSEGPQGECPFCNAIIGLKALRCNECGRPVRRAPNKRNYIPAVYSAFGVILVITLGWLLYSLVFQEEPEPEREHINASHQQLIRLYRSDKFKERWDTQHKDQFVEWDNPGYVLEVRDDKSIALGASSKSDRTKPEVVLTLKSPEEIEARGLKEGKLVKYSAQLDRYEGKTIYLKNGILQD